MNPTWVTMDDGVRLRAQIAGPAGRPVVLFCHSVGCSLELWEAQFQALEDDFRVVRYDARGHGRSDAPENDYDLSRITRDALAIMDWADAPAVHLCGLSLGGTTAMSLALDAPGRLSSMILANSSARMGTPEGWQARMDAAREKGMEALADFSMTRFFSEHFRGADPQTVASFRAVFAATSAHGYAGCCAVLRDADFVTGLSRIETPTLVVCGRLDLPAPVADGEILKTGIRNAQMCVLPTGHLSNIEAPEAFTARLKAWLSKS